MRYVAISERALKKIYEGAIEKTIFCVPLNHRLGEKTAGPDVMVSRSPMQMEALRRMVRL